MPIDASLSLFLPGRGRVEVRDVLRRPEMLEGITDVDGLNGMLVLEDNISMLALEDMVGGLMDFFLGPARTELSDGAELVYAFRSGPETCTVTQSGDEVRLDYDDSADVEATRAEWDAMLEDLGRIDNRLRVMLGLAEPLDEIEDTDEDNDT